MSGMVAARRAAGWCIVALSLLGGPAAALPVADSDMAEIAIENAPHDARGGIRIAAIAPAVTMPAPPAAADEPFGMQTSRVQAGGLWRKWHGVEAAIRAEREVLARCRAGIGLCPPAATKFLAIVEAGRARTGRARVGQINRAINLAIRPMSDLAQYGVADRWSSPLATLVAGRGDCEDYAIAKYVALQEAGIPASDLRLVIVRDEAANVDHAVVAVQLDGGWIVLDNRHLTLVASADLHRVVPLFVLDGAGVKRFSSAPTGVAGLRAAPPTDGPRPAAAPAGL
jgi:predicted transglutaminase-like cysteine proteinase